MDSFLTFINQQGWDLNGKKSLLTVSGGIDSVVLAHLFHENKFKAGIAHCNFKLRGEESETDAHFVREIANHYGFEFFSTSFETKSVAKEKGVSTQMAARELRYKWFENLRQAEQYDWIVTAHHNSDSLETAILNLTRGTGLSGIKGIMPRVNAIIRPMLRMTKEEILKYAADHALQWREDKSNSSVDYKRNRVRHQIIPVLKKLNPSVEETFINTSERLLASDNLLKELLESWKQGAIHSESGLVYIDKRHLLNSSEPALRLWTVLQDYKFTYPQVKSICTALKGTVGKTLHSMSHDLLIDRDYLILRPSSDLRGKYEIEVFESDLSIVADHLLLSFEETSDIRRSELGKDKAIIFIDTEKLKWPLKIRKWQTGDSFFPFGMGGKRKKLSDLFNDLKINRYQKEESLVLVNGNGDIIWVLGIRMDERFKVPETASKVLKIALLDK
ncbi:tRNA lysidine(34) synthetase TilS [Dyadobacter aurulentus]|uniref:tRNA lysidine(34) synthetase TilS n=1 Tax=Dyadobacter sp. UC 10 TaxID=2605428 RepID=UPI0011F305DF|nr:tRNA lysidine(34) synthetase TilS [Dyadobacter sp. UC 10]KAA0989283.1 tRNA lysidine(34) synthetase TilS [Dyadobacter sp. UC 10]